MISGFPGYHFEYTPLRKNKKRFKTFSTRKHVQRGSKSMYSNYIANAFTNIFQFLIQREPDRKGSYLICIDFYLFNSPFASFSKTTSRLLHPWLSCSCCKIHTNPQIQKIDMIAVLKLIKHNEHRTAHYPIFIYHTIIYHTRKAHILNLTPLSIPSWWH